MKPKLLHFTYTVILLLLLCGSLSASVHTRVVLISNTHDFPSSGLGTLVVEVEAISDDGQEFIGVFQNAFQLDAVFRGQNPQVSFSNQRFPADLVPPGLPNYTVTEEYRDSDGRISYTYTYNAGTFASIEITYTTIVRITIEYQMAAESGSINWFIGLPNYLVRDFTFSDITGNKEAIPPSLTDISLPVELSTFSAVGVNGKVTLSWSTESEINNLGFEVYRAPEEEAAYILLSSYATNPDLKGQGNSNSQHEYSYIDESIEPETTYWYKLADVDFNGVKAFQYPISVTVPKALVIPTAFKLHSNYPNPFNPITTLRFDIPSTGVELVDTKLIIYNSLGQVIKTLYQDKLSAGSYKVQWDGTTDFGNNAPSGIYFAIFKADGFSQTRKLVLLK